MPPFLKSGHIQTQTEPIVSECLSEINNLVGPPVHSNNKKKCYRSTAWVVNACCNGLAICMCRLKCHSYD